MDGKTFLLCSEDERKSVLAKFGRTEKSLRDDVDAIKAWMAKQPHMPEVASYDRIERFLFINKCSVENTKLTLDRYYTGRTTLVEVFDNNDPFDDVMKNIAKVFLYVPLPKLNKDNKRVIVVKLMGEVEQFDIITAFKLIANVIEIRLFEDCCDGDINIYCMDTFKWGHCAKIINTTLSKYDDISDKMFNKRVSQMHYVNPPPFFQAFYNLLKPLLKKSFLDKGGLIVHENLESLYEHVSRNILPKDLGGDEKTLEELNDDFQKTFVKYKPWFDKLKTLKVDESLRPKQSNNDDLLGCYGYFKKLEID